MIFKSNAVETFLAHIVFLIGIFAFSMSLASADDALQPKIIAIGDIHGDYDAYENLMLESGLMDADGNWSGESTIFVQTGDIPDRGPDTRKIIESLMRLEQQAPDSGGKVIPLVGNHEAMNMIGDLRYVHPGEYAAFINEDSEALRNAYYATRQSDIEAAFRKEAPDLSSEVIRAMWDNQTPLGKLEHRAAWRPEGYIGKWVAGNQLVAKVQGYLFVHGGLSQEFTEFTLDELNAAGRQALLTKDTSREGILRHRLGPVWYRGNVRGRENARGYSQRQEIEKVLDTYDATHIIVGHTRNEKGIRVSLNGRLLQIDTGASAHYGGVPSFLRIENGEFFAHARGKSIKLKAYAK